MKPNSLQELYTEQLRDLYDAEQQIIKTLPEMISAAASSDLKSALTDHLNVTKSQAKRLEQIFHNLHEKPKGETCKGMQGVLEEGSDLVGGIKNAGVRDAAIIAAAQRVEHYEMAGYGTARTYATLLEENGAVDLLQQTLNEEKDADDKLTSLAGEINMNASAGDSQAAAESSRGRRKIA